MTTEHEKEQGDQMNVVEPAPIAPALVQDLTLGKTGEQASAELKVRPTLRHTAVTARINMIAGDAPFGGMVSSLAEINRDARDGKLGAVSDILTSQAVTLDALFTDMMQRSLKNVGQYPEAAERYMRMAMKAQTQCRTTIEALTKLARGGEQVVRHVHVDNRGGQAVIAETVQTGKYGPLGGNGGEFDGQAHAPLGDAHLAALPGQNPLGNGMPIGSHEEREVSYARRPLDGRSEG